MGVTSSPRINARPRKPIAIKPTPPIISQCGKSIDQSKPIISPSPSPRSQKPLVLASPPSAALDFRGKLFEPVRGPPSPSRPELAWLRFGFFARLARAVSVRSPPEPFVRLSHIACLARVDGAAPSGGRALGMVGGDGGDRGGSGSRADMELPPKRKTTPSDAQSFRFALSPASAFDWRRRCMRRSRTLLADRLRDIE